MPCITALNRFPARENPFTHNTDFLQCGNCTFTACLIIIHYQNRQIHQIFVLFFFCFLKIQINCYCDFSSLVQGTVHFNSAIHQVHNISADCHSQTSSLDSGCPVVIRTAERLKHDFLEFR